MSELFNVDHLCFNLEDNDRYMIVLSVFAIIALVILSIIAMTLYGFFKKPVNMNEKQHVSYASLKTGNDNNATNVIGIDSESKVSNFK